MKVLDLFSGIGGFSLGLERAGMETVAFCEIEPFCQKVLKKHWPGVPIYEDVRELTNDRLRADGIFPDIITGGFPCTQTSVAASIHGKRKGLAGKDSKLWYEMLRLVEECQPVWVIPENPGGVKKWEGEIQGRMERAGYRVSKLDFKASDFGLPNKRKRYFYVANRNGERLEVARPGRSPSIEWISRLTSAGGTWITNPPGIGGDFNGLPYRVDRIKALGNSVVPQIPELIGRAIMESV